MFNLRDCVFDSMFPGANFSRRILCLEILTLLEPILNKVLNSLTISGDQLWKQAEADAILLCLSDSYESNKKLAASLLKQCPPKLLKLHVSKNTISRCNLTLNCFKTSQRVLNNYWDFLNK